MMENLLPKENAWMNARLELRQLIKVTEFVPVVVVWVSCNKKWFIM